MDQRTLNNKPAREDESVTLPSLANLFLYAATFGMLGDRRPPKNRPHWLHRWFVAVIHAVWTAIGFLVLVRDERMSHSMWIVSWLLYLVLGFWFIRDFLNGAPIRNE